MYRASYHPSADYYNGQNGPSTGAVPRSSWHGGGDPNKPAPRPYQEEYSTTGQVALQIDGSKDNTQKDGGKNSMTKTYYTIKDMISSRFKGNKDMVDDKAEEAGLNNVTEELRKSQRNLGEPGFLLMTVNFHNLDFIPPF